MGFLCNSKCIIQSFSSIHIISSDGKTVAEEGPAGVLNLVVERYNKDVSAEIAPLDNIGISVDGKLNLLTNLETLDKISIYTSL